MRPAVVAAAASMTMLCGPWACSSNRSGESGVAGVYCDTVPSSPEVHLAIDMMQQWCPKWCWSAVTTAVANYYGVKMGGRTVQECSLASANARFADLSTCCQHAACAYTPCDQSQSPDGALEALGIRGVHVDEPLDPPTVMSELANGRPVIVHRVGPNSNHVSLIVGYEAGTVPTFDVLDPWPYAGHGSTSFDMTYAELLAGMDGQHWVGSYYRLSPRSDGCSPPVNPTCTCRAP